MMGLNCVLKKYFKKRKGKEKEKIISCGLFFFSLRLEVSHFGWKDDYGRIH